MLVNALCYLCHRDDILTREGIVVKCHLIEGEKLIAAILDKLEANQTCSNELFKFIGDVNRSVQI